MGRTAEEKAAAAAREAYRLNPEKFRARRREWVKNNWELEKKLKRGYYAKNSKIKDYQRALVLKKKYGMTPEDYNDMLHSQGYRCAICDTEEWAVERGLRVDHDHDDGHVRGLLCNKCNLGLGNFKDDPSLLRKALDYLAAA